jgi:ankyrin repeat protein
MKLLKILIIALFIFSFSWVANADDIHIAAAKGKIKWVKMILKDRPNVVNSRDIQDATPLIMAAKNGHYDVCSYLLKKGADVNSNAFIYGTPLHVAKTTKIAELLLNNGADINAKATKVEDSVLHTASWRGNLEVCGLIIEKGIDVNVNNKLKFTPLHSASAFGKSDVAKFLMEKGADFDARNNDGWTPLHLAAGLGKLETAQALIDGGSDINVQDEFFKATALHWAVGLSRKKMVSLLIDNGADTTIKNSDGKTASKIAAELNRKDIEEIILEDREK